MNLAAEPDDMAMLRLIARDSWAVALVPAVVVIDEPGAGILEQHAAVPNLHEEFCAISVRHHYQHTLGRPLPEQSATAALTMPG